MKLKQLLLIALLFSATFGFTKDKNENKSKKKTVSVSGQVVDNSGSLVGVKVLLDGKEYAVYTDFDGRFIIENVPAGKHSITLDMVTYESKTVQFDTEKTDDLAIKLYGK